ncbi:hypothetical protein [Mycobacterium servetii]|uniref:Proline rich protein n=1 Tax=Mycobacterium servetii TaxID=3237418 RepID=A0ABV4BWU8_9MYCO
MAESPQPSVPGTAPAAESPRYDAPSGPSRLSQALMWVGIVAGILFVVAVVFFSGFFLGWSSGGHYGSHRDGWVRMGPGAPGGMMGPGGPMSPGGMMGPGGLSGPPTSPATPTPTSRP